ncbi:MAG: GNAT family N-acetyltransferase [Deltaproteobacteria bacterium]|jgi:amino-acid N-acetyltransferase|nr:GNAT family N-acetyltransferase [Deltaproteobacteria bacterium]MBW2530837.1 GNAT family N-acetyltransferase [Deltaproteobacteria bacterium]
MPDDDRTPPTKIRITGLQEVQLERLARIAQECAAMLLAAGVAPERVSPLDYRGIAKLHRDHDLHVAEADNAVAGYLAWRDEQPKVGVVAILNVSPEYQRFGVGTRLLRAMAESCADKEIDHVVARCFDDASFAVAFLKRAGFAPAVAGAELPQAVREWQDRRAAAGELATAGETLYWRQRDELGVQVLPGIPRPADAG